MITIADAVIITFFFQDELEFGYIDSPHQQFPVVLDSPRDGNMRDFPYKELLVKDTPISPLRCFRNQETSCAPVQGCCKLLRIEGG